ncbi:uncharacterized protein LOC128556989 isoform X2 [Mercenaria mercenaria]|uniref:uncharacterized protein LOC128556989 isoform X2 n=1 Tax=Mercenaria mercenaria TaxID=6596 RepID=UPI00234F925C|nr:uncharacterized protein LOC128556989 isoform X2 [Mercenaria mercenaria]
MLLCIMKLGKEMELDKSKTVLQPIVEKKATNYFKIAFLILLAVIAVGAISITAVYVGGKLSRDAFKEAGDKYRFHTTDGQTINESITVTDTEEDISFEDGSHIIFDYSKGFMVMKVTEDDRVACFVANFERRNTHAPTADELKKMKLDNLTVSEEIDYYIDRSSPADPSILSERSRKACKGAEIYWITTNKMKDTSGRRRKRGWGWFRRNCRTVCYPTCCWGFKCQLKCTF